MKLWHLAHSRSGDKGSTSNISVISYRNADYDLLRDALSAERVGDYLAQMFPAAACAKELKVERYELPCVGALNFVVTEILRGGVTRSLALDAHGKTLGSILLNMDVPDYR